MGQKLPERFLYHESAFSLSVIHERCGLTLIKPSDGDASVLQPLRKISTQPQLRLHGERRIAIFLYRCGK
jgi:hypothetical protein